MFIKLTHKKVFEKYYKNHAYVEIFKNLKLKIVLHQLKKIQKSNNKNAK